MTIPLRNTIFEKIKESNSLTDVELYKSLTKDGLNLPEDKFNKTTFRFRNFRINQSSMVYKR